LQALFFALYFFAPFFGKSAARKGFKGFLATEKWLGKTCNPLKPFASAGFADCRLKTFTIKGFRQYKNDLKLTKESFFLLHI
jgi:hypothetical protein